MLQELGHFCSEINQVGEKVYDGKDGLTYLKVKVKVNVDLYSALS